MSLDWLACRCTIACYQDLSSVSPWKSFQMEKYCPPQRLPQETKAREQWTAFPQGRQCRALLAEPWSLLLYLQQLLISFLYPCKPWSRRGDHIAGTRPIRHFYTLLPGPGSVIFWPNLAKYGASLSIPACCQHPVPTRPHLRLQLAAGRPKYRAACRVFIQGSFISHESTWRIKRFVLINDAN